MLSAGSEHKRPIGGPTRPSGHQVFSQSLGAGASRGLCALATSTPATCCMAGSKGRRLAIYIPDELEPDIRRALQNGRALQDLRHEWLAGHERRADTERAHAHEAET